MNREQDFLEQIRRFPADGLTRLMYAHWLGAQSDPVCRAKAAFLRLQHQQQVPGDGHAGSAIREDERDLAHALEPGWRRDVYCGPVERFGPPPARCHLRWNELAPSDDPSVRLCPTCGERVAYCGSVADARVAAGYCYEAVVVDPAERRSEDDLHPAPEAVSRPDEPTLVEDRSTLLLAEPSPTR